MMSDLGQVRSGQAVVQLIHYGQVMAEWSKTPATNWQRFSAEDRCDARQSMICWIRGA